MTSSYLVCDLCGKHGPPAGYFFEDGIRLCYECFLRENAAQEHEKTNDGSGVEEQRDKQSR